MRRSLGALGTMVLLVGTGALGGLSAQAPARAAAPAATAVTPASQDVLPALLVEVRGLRAAMEQMASAGPRIQLFVGRLQLQEARINGMLRRLDTVRDSLAPVKTRYDEAAATVQRLQTNGARDPNISREEVEQVIEQQKRVAAATKVTVDRLTAEEMRLTSDIAAEQGRWIEINQRLDELERALVRR